MKLQEKQLNSLYRQYNTYTRQYNAKHINSIEYNFIPQILFLFSHNIFVYTLENPDTKMK